ncbi:hypothetical protein BGZ49_009473 [Haplosporangium sp. Z 27]|nr:hypothetical protein BGZ49_009473 [Haplosporangium sp. Z 27]
MRYTQSCVFEATLPTNSTKTVCKDWEYLGQNSCFLKTCGPGLDCEPPWVCRRSNFTGTEAPYGLCMSANSTVDPSDDGDGDSSTPHDRLIVGILVGVCSLVLGVGVGTGICHYRKRRMRQMAVRSLDPNANSLNQKSSTLRTYFDACCCCFYGANMGLQGNNMDIDNSQDDDVRGPRVLSVTESDQGTENSLISSHRSNLVFARRWRWGAGRHAGEDTSGGRVGVTSGGVAVLPEFEPPPLYNQGPDLPTYRDRNSIMLTSVSRPHSVGNQIPLENIETGDQPTSPTSISKPRNEEL